MEKRRRRRRLDRKAYIGIKVRAGKQSVKWLSGVRRIETESDRQ